MPNTKPTIAEILVSMPDVGEDADFARVDDSADKMLAVGQMQKFMTSAPCVEQVDLKALIEDVRASGEILDVMIDQMKKATASADAAIDDALAEVDASNQRIESMDRKAKGKAT
jgi:hypothetical protein